MNKQTWNMLTYFFVQQYHIRGQNERRDVCKLGSTQLGHFPRRLGSQDDSANSTVLIMGSLERVCGMRKEI